MVEMIFELCKARPVCCKAIEITSCRIKSIEKRIDILYYNPILKGTM
jgi:hypothetical protein